MKKYVVMVDYGCYEGWQIEDQTDDFDEAVKIREAALSNHHGTGTVQIFKPVELVVTEKAMDFQEAKSIFIQQIRKQTAVGILIDALEAGERADLLLAELETKKAGLAQEIAHLTEQRDAGIAEAKEAAEKEAAKSYAKARGELTSLHKAIQEATLELNRRKDEHLAHLHQRNEEEAKWESMLASRKAGIAEAKASYWGIEQDIMKMTVQQQVLRDEWEGEQRAAERKLAAMKQEIGALFVKLHKELAS